MLHRGSLFVCGCVVAASLTTTPCVAQTLLPPAGGTFVADTGSELPFIELFDDTIRDFKQLPSRDTLTWLAVGGALALSSTTLDEPASATMSASSALEDPFQPGETIGGAKFQIVAATAAYAIGRFSGNRKAAAFGSDLLRAQIVTQTITAAAKMSVRRGRPDGTQFSFPSGHSSVTFASATVVQRHFGWKFGVPAYALASYVAASRIQEKRHYLSDVAFGAAVGIVVGRTVTVGRGGGKFAVSPMAAPGGAGVSFTWLGQP